MESKALEFAINKLSECQLFVQIVADREEIQKRVNRNVEKIVIIKDKKDGRDGYYNYKNKKIFIIGYGDVQQFEENFDTEEKNEIKSLIEHEVIHAVLANISETEMINISTGILEIYRDGTELGRALNEALTEWIVKKTGLDSTGYSTELKILEQIELAIGERAVMQMANGGIETNIANVLQMTDIECRSFLAKIDNILSLRHEVYNLEGIIKLLEEKSTIIDTNPKRVAEIDAILNGNIVYLSLLERNEYIIYLGKNSADDNWQSRLGYLKKIKKIYEANLRSEIIGIESEIYDRYFEKDLQMLNESKKISYEKAKKSVEKYDMYMNLIMSKSMELEESYNPSVSDLRNKLVNIESEYTNVIREKLIDVIDKGDMKYQKHKAKEKTLKQKVSFYGIMSAIGKKVVDTITFKKKREESLKLPEGIVRRKAETFAERLNPENYSAPAGEEVLNEIQNGVNELNGDGR